MALLETSTRYALVKYPANGTQVDFLTSFVGGYINASYVKAYSFVTADGSDFRSETCTLVSAGPASATFRVAAAGAVPAGRTVQIQRETPKGDPLVDFENGSMLTASNLNLVTEQAIQSIAEAYDQFQELTTEVGGDAEAARILAQQALNTAQQADTTANSAASAASQAFIKAEAAEAGIAAATAAAAAATNSATNAQNAANAATQLVQNIQGEVDAAVATANAASANANAASEAANAVADVAQDALDTADSAVAQVQTAVNAANAAVATANGVDGKAQTALDASAAATAAAADAVKKTPTTAQTINSDLKTTKQLRAGLVVNVEKDQPASGDFNDYSINFLNADASQRYGGIRFQRFAGSEWSSPNMVLEGRGSNYIAFKEDGNVVVGSGGAGTIMMRNQFNVYSGAVGVLTVLTTLGWGNRVTRWGQALAPNGDLQLYSFDATGANAQLVSQYGNKSSVAGAWTVNYSARTVFQGEVDTASWSRSASSSASPLSFGNAALFTTGSYGGVFEQQDGAHGLRYYFAGGAGYGGIAMHQSGVYMGDVLTYGPICKARGGFQALSSRLSKNIHGKNTRGLMDILKVVTVLGKYKDAPTDAGARLFFIAEQLNKVIPEMVDMGSVFSWNGQELPTVDYDQGVVVAFKGISDLYEIVSEAISEFDARLTKLENKS